MTRYSLFKNLTILWVASALVTCMAQAQIFGSVRGVVHDPQHRPIQGAMVMLKASASDWVKTADTDPNGEFLLNAVPLGE